MERGWGWEMTIADTFSVHRLDHGISCLPRLIVFHFRSLFYIFLFLRITCSGWQWRSTGREEQLRPVHFGWRDQFWYRMCHGKYICILLSNYNCRCCSVTAAWPKISSMYSQPTLWLPLHFRHKSCLSRMCRFHFFEEYNVRHFPPALHYR